MILIVEDEAVSRRALLALLTAAGFTTCAVQTAEEALALINRGQIPEIALIDLDLPGMNGLELIRRMERTNPSVYPVLITATSAERLANFRKEHPVDYLRKPLDFDELLSLISENQQRN